jgi:transposase
MLPVQATDSRIFAQLSVTDAAFSDTRQQYRANRIGSRSVKQISTIGLDLAKNVFQIHGADAEGAPVLNRKLRRVEVLRYFEKLPPCLVGLEACGGSHYWAREMAGLYAPLPTLRRRPRGRRRTDRGRRGLLLLHRSGLSPHTPCQSPGALTRVTACTLALSPIRDTHSEGFSYLVTSIAAPVASGWSGCRVDLHPLESAALSRRTPQPDIRLIVIG